MLRRHLRTVDRWVGRAGTLAIAAFDRVSRSVRRLAGKERQPVDPPRRILVIKLVGVGDAVLMLTAIHALRQRYPQASISALATPLSAEVVADQACVDEVIVFDVFGRRGGPLGLVGLVGRLRRRQFDCVIDFEQHFQLTSVISYLTGAPKRIGFFFKPGGRGVLLTNPVFLAPDSHMLRAYMSLLEPLGVDGADTSALATIDIPRADRAAVEIWLSSNRIPDDDALVGIHPGSGPRARQRRWPKERFARIVRLLRDEVDATVVLTGDRGEEALIDQIIKLAGREKVYGVAGLFNLKQTAALIEKCDLFLSNDTGPMHLSAAAGTATIGIFGPEAPSRYAPVGRSNAVVYKSLPCSPCVRIHEGRSYDCPDAACIDAVSVDDVWSEILRYDLARSQKRRRCSPSTLGR